MDLMKKRAKQDNSAQKVIVHDRIQSNCVRVF